MASESPWAISGVKSHYNLSTQSYLWSWESLQFVSTYVCEAVQILSLMQQEASALWNTVVINNNGILIHFS
jgi:hypothetical protein